MNLHYRIDGASGKPALILLNGLFADLNSWDACMPYLQDFCVLRYDGRGQGQSPKPHEIYDLDTFVEDLLGLVTKLDWPPSILVGISNGGSVGLEFTRRFPERVRCLVAADCHHETTPLMRLKLKSWLAAHEMGGPAHRFDVAVPWIWSESILREHPELIEHYRSKAGDQEDQAVRGLIGGALTININVGEIRRPVLLLTGEEDLLTPPFLMESMRIPQSEHRVTKGGHASLLERPDIFGEHIVPFLRGMKHVG